MHGSGLPTIPRGLTRLLTARETVGNALPTDRMALVRPRRPLEIAGNALPSNSMSVQARLEKVTTANGVITGVRNRLMGEKVLWVGGRKLTPAGLIALYEEQLAALEQVRQAWIAYQVALAAERQLRRPMQSLTVDVKNTVTMLLGENGFPEFGWKKPKKPGPKTVKSKLAGVEKRAAKKKSG